MPTSRVGAEVMPGNSTDLKRVREVAMLSLESTTHWPPAEVLRCYSQELVVRLILLMTVFVQELANIC